VRPSVPAMVKERDDTIKNLRAKLEDVYEGRETDVRANPLPHPSHLSS